MFCKSVELAPATDLWCGIRKSSVVLDQGNVENIHSDFFPSLPVGDGTFTCEMYLRLSQELIYLTPEDVSWDDTEYHE